MKTNLKSFHIEYEAKIFNKKRVGYIVNQLNAFRNSENKTEFSTEMKNLQTVKFHKRSFFSTLKTKCNLMKSEKGFNGSRLFWGRFKFRS
jgi:hypothetical protein